MRRQLLRREAPYSFLGMMVLSALSDGAGVDLEDAFNLPFAMVADEANLSEVEAVNPNVHDPAV